MFVIVSADAVVVINMELELCLLEASVEYEKILSHNYSRTSFQ
jgi:hypothetical protein